MSKNVYVLPIGALIFLIVLIYFQRQQTKTAQSLREAPDTSTSALVLEDKLADGTQGKIVECGAFPFAGLEYEVEMKGGKGALEFDLMEAEPAGAPDLLLFAISSKERTACQLTLATMLDALTLAFQPKEGRLVLMLNGSMAAFTLGAGRVLPLHFACEWDGKIATLFVNGSRLGQVEHAAGMAPGPRKLFLCRSLPEKGKGVRVAAANIRLHLIPKS